MAKTSTPNNTLAALPAQIEIFRAGQHTDDSGTVHSFSAADVAGMVAAYDPAQREAPLTVGHPAHNLPAYGWVKKIELNAAGNLAMTTHQVLPAFAEMVASGAFKKRSASFYPPKHPNNPSPDAWYLRHVAFLGAQPPAIAGLADFAAGSADGAVNFSSGDGLAGVQALASSTPPLLPPTSSTPDLTQEQNDMTEIEQLKADIAAAKAKQAETDAALALANTAATASATQLAQFAEAAKATRTAGFVAFAEGVNAAVLLPKDRPMAVAALEALADAQPVSFAEGGSTKTVALTEWLKTRLASGTAAVSFGEHAPGGVGFADGQATKGMTEAEIDAKARGYAAHHKVSYAEALTAVVSFTA